MDPWLNMLVDQVRDAMVVFHYPSSRFGPTYECGACGEPIWHTDGSWRNVHTESDVCTAASAKRQRKD